MTIWSQQVKFSISKLVTILAAIFLSGKYEPGNPKKPLHLCNFYGSVEAGNKLKEMLELGNHK